MDINRLRKQLEGEKNQLEALIKYLENAGNDPSQLNQLEICRKNYDLKVSQLSRLDNLQQK